MITVVLYSAPSRNLLRSAPSPTSVKQDSLKVREELSRVGYWGQTQCHWKPIPGHRASHRKGAVLSDSSPSTGDKELRLHRRAQRDTTRNSNSRAAEFPQIWRSQALSATSDQCRDPVGNALRVGKPMEDNPHVP